MVDPRLYLDVVVKLLTKVPPGKITSIPHDLIPFLNHNELSARAYETVVEIYGWQELLNQGEIDKLKIAKHQAIARNRLAKTALKDTIALLSGYNYIYFKGLLAAFYHPNPQNRHPGDLDILVQIDQFDDVVEVFCDNGWTLQKSVHWKREKKIAEQYGFALVLRHPEIPITLDLHRAVVDRTEPFWIPSSDLLKCKRYLSIDKNLAVSAPSVEDHLAILALHSVRHAYFKITWFYDIYCLLNSNEIELDEELFRKRTKDWRISKAVNTSIALTQKIFRFRPKNLAVDTSIVEIQRTLNRRPPSLIMRGKDVSPRNLRRLTGLIDLQDSRSEAFGYLKRLLFPPKALLREFDDPEISLVQYVLNRLSRGFGINRQEPKKSYFT
ncbi:nucleotidyltransferase family protein [bacterium]|nr:nucleotidyltransferase family protein [bacterium]